MSRHRCDADAAYAGDHFAEYYNHLCARQGTFPVATMRAHKAMISDRLLKICVDRLTEQDWYPLLAALKINTRLEKIIIESRWSQLRRKALRERRRHRGSTSSNRGLIPPALQQRPLIHHSSAADDLLRCLKVHISSNQQLQSLELVGIPLSQRHVLHIAQPVSKHRSLSSLALRDCSLDDDAMEVVGGMLQGSACIMSADLSHNKFGERGCRCIAQAIKAHNAKRGMSSWQQSLRNELADVSRMRGLRAIDLSHCKGVKDAGGMELALALDDDDWLLSLNLSHCGLTSATAKALMQCLVNNTGLLELKLRGNKITKAQRAQLTKVMSLNRVEYVGLADQHIQRAHEDMQGMVAGLSALRKGSSRPVSRSQPQRSSSRPASRRHTAHLEGSGDGAQRMTDNLDSRWRDRHDNDDGFGGDDQGPPASVTSDASALLDELEFELDDLATDEALDDEDVEAMQLEHTIRKLHELVDKLKSVQGAANGHSGAGPTAGSNFA
eukprot:TRINITY_DN7795_c0_g1_i3.p1 TRINITY_DN7795_c0_g1~~TRINITY_DN7795_c0_g1_i3.p1  ORF type:complete len:497 (+),score=103.34 TRINITY_DN7795_c0_g1_i3:59-1549(+)